MNIEQKLVSSMRAVALDSINYAKSGHSGMSVGVADITATLFTKFLNITNLNPKWINRDKFILSAGHGSMGIYSIMHFMGLLTLDEMKAYRKLGCKTSAHPEEHAFEYIDASTGALGQGVAMGVGMALARDYLAKKFNKDNFNLFDHSVYVLHGDGCLQEGVALEAIQLAGTLKLNNFVLIHDFNGIQIDTQSKLVNNIDFKAFFKAQNFNVVEVNSNIVEIEQALEQIKHLSGPTYLQVHTNIAKYTPNEDTPKGHAGTFDEATTNQIKEKMGLCNTNPFEYDQQVYEYASSFWKAKNDKYASWNELLNEYTNSYPELASQIKQLINGEITYDFSDVEFSKDNLSTREYAGEIIKNIEQKYWSVLGGSADLASSTKVGFKHTIQQGGQGILYGIREHAMSAINNGIYLASKLKTLASTFLVFSDYAKGALRSASLMKLPVINVYSHDSYAIGSDGPTHQPTDQLPMLRSIKNMLVIRPCDQYETKAAFAYSLNQNQEQISIITSRQGLKSYPNNLKNQALDPLRLIANYQGNSDKNLIILASGSEVELAHKAAEKLNTQHNVNTKVYSVPVLQWIVQNEELIKEFKLDSTPTLALEASSDSMWYRIAQYTRFDAILATEYGHSADGQQVYEMNGFNVENVIDKALKLLNY
ncbi:transketolase family protein [Mycoplasma simbae]|uniref:transketolase-like TK C-terminal-containing protein n=1 Tax=Mycoplasma simbae TaxID=36744 RepID=UPI00049755E5|nr:transketolase [Mycoplasma simbae]